MKNILILLLAVMPILLFSQTSESSCPRKEGIVVTYSKEMLQTTKDVLHVIVCTDAVQFNISHTAIQKFVKVGDKWHQITSNGDYKEVHTFVDEKQGVFYFEMSEKKYLGYIIKEEQ